MAARKLRLLAGLVVGVVGYAALMGLKEDGPNAWSRDLIAGAAGACLGVALIHARRWRERASP